MSNWSSNFRYGRYCSRSFRTKINITFRRQVGKTTAIREIARVLSDGMQKRMIIIDTSNEIAEGVDLPHPSMVKQGVCKFLIIKTA